MTFKQAISGGIPPLADIANRQNYEIAVVDGRNGEYRIGHINDSGEFIWGLLWPRFDDKKVRNWTSTDHTVLIVL